MTPHSEINCPAYTILSRTTQKAPFPCWCIQLLHAQPSVQTTLKTPFLFCCLWATVCLFRSHCLATGLHATIWILEHPSHIILADGPGFNSASNRNECQESSFRVKGGHHIWLTTLPSSVNWLSRENVGASTSHNPTGLHGLLKG
jgi:hypothetical protein